MNETAPRAATLSSRQENEAAARSRIYTLLGEALAYPRGDNVLRLLDGDWLAELTQAIEHSGLSIDCPAQLTLPEGQRAIETLEQEYSNLFDVLGGTPRVSMLERAYVDQNEQALWQELLAREAEWQTNGIKSIKLIGDAESPAPIAWATYAGHRYARELDQPDAGDDLPFRREVTQLKND